MSTPEASLSTTEEAADSQKVTILLKAAADAPILKTKKYNVSREKTVAWIANFVKQRIHCQPDESVFLYVSQAFVPPPDQTVHNLYESFGSDGKLVFHYCKSQAWG
ncbi:ubiquitin-like protein ATG12 [Corticium candelabrum]|uniref:ubiquitin-like protein ATG12 n=1 Tax=Corticium candelabrum TaxID=121492 RepID=UPI002E314213|nr:ubiquitin-like protein ATG12 [Corticium candelabrum]